MKDCHPTSQGFPEVAVSTGGSKSKTVRRIARRELWACQGHRGLPAGFFLGVFLLFVPGAYAQRTQLKPGWNKFSPQEDITLGKRAATDAEKQLPLCNAPKVDAYLTQLGTRLAQKLPTGGVQYPFEFHCVNDKAINAFALPGGYVFVNRGAIEAADNEAQLAGVMAHELSHVALRHGTNQEMKGKNPPEFFSDHPNPEHRVERVDEEIDKLGGVPPNAKRDSQEFEAIKREVLALPVVKKPTPGAAGAVAAPAPPSGKFAAYQANAYTLKYPENWKKYPDKDGGGVSFAPEGGVLDDGSGHSALAYGLIVGVAQAKGDPNDSNALDAAARQVIQGLQQANPNMKVARQSERVRLNGQPGLSTYLTNDSPAGGQETDWVITVLRPEGTVYFVCVAPQSAYSNYDKTFSAILDSVRFTK